MIPFIRSLSELMIMTESRDKNRETINNQPILNITEDSGQRKRYLRSKGELELELPNLKKATRNKWLKGKKVISSLINELDYNNQIQSTYDLTLLERQNKIDHHEAA